MKASGKGTKGTVPLLLDEVDLPLLRSAAVIRSGDQDIASLNIDIKTIRIRAVGIWRLHIVVFTPMISTLCEQMHRTCDGEIIELEYKIKMKINTK
jgi:hypothetical protein